MNGPRKNSCVHAERIVLAKSRSFFKNHRIPTGAVITFPFTKQLWRATYKCRSCWWKPELIQMQQGVVGRQPWILRWNVVTSMC